MFLVKVETVLGTDLRHACTLCVGEGVCIYVNMSICLWVHVCKRVCVCLSMHMWGAVCVLVYGD